MNFALRQARQNRNAVLHTKLYDETKMNRLNNNKYANIIEQNPLDPNMVGQALEQANR